ncbi:hypothetical protein EYF80_012870 [Liparis tanakae]|uniref:Uncharacterized protein n=1 Tax=Liparis tanakae TaxID=230148 RepID=A0A4Z2IGA7_9TELE|nr:hypothetical protein EYF80_012870 [Liparis tanakae]
MFTLKLVEALLTGQCAEAVHPSVVGCEVVGLHVYPEELDVPCHLSSRDLAEPLEDDYGLVPEEVCQQEDRDEEHQAGIMQIQNCGVIVAEEEEEEDRTKLRGEMAVGCDRLSIATCDEDGVTPKRVRNHAPQWETLGKARIGLAMNSTIGPAA